MSACKQHAGHTTTDPTHLDTVVRHEFPEPPIIRTWPVRTSGHAIVILYSTRSAVLWLAECAKEVGEAAKKIFKGVSVRHGKWPDVRLTVSLIRALPRDLPTCAEGREDEEKRLVAMFRANTATT
jgi:hypothetical protein